ncbi:MAG: hypothetical protein ACK2UH_04710, partial [Candidatus Promineifilaceae bacterium]
MNKADVVVPAGEVETDVLALPADQGSESEANEVAAGPGRITAGELVGEAILEPVEESAVAEEESTTPLLPRAVVPQPVPEGARLKNPSLYFNQELSWIDFNWRVLHLALDERTPLMERVRFVAITASNLDEFIQKRVGGLKRQEAAGVRKLSPDGRTPSEQLALVLSATKEMHRTMTGAWENSLKPALAERAGIVICNYDDLSAGERDKLRLYFQNDIYPILTPLTVDPGHPFPFISNLSLSLSFILRHP